MLDAGDLYRSIAAMLQGTIQTPKTDTDEAARLIQKSYRGHVTPPRHEGLGQRGRGGLTRGGGAG